MLLHPSQREIIPQPLLLGNLSGCNASVTNIRDEYVDPLIPPAENQGKNFEFSVISSSEYMQIDNLRLKLTLSIKKKNLVTGQLVDIEPSDRVSFINGIHFSLFKDCVASLNGQTIGASDGCYAMKSYLHTLLTNDKFQCLFKLKETINFHLDTPRYMHSTDSVPTVGASGGQGKAGTSVGLCPNTGWDDRREELLKNKSITLIDKLHMCDLTTADKYLLPGLKLHVTLTRHDDNYALICGENDNNIYHIVIQQAQLIVSFVEVTTQMRLAHYDYLKTKRQRISITRSEMKTSNIAQGVFSWKCDSLFTTVPNHLLICFASASSAGGLRHLNPFALNHFSVKNIHVRCGPTSVSPTPLSFDFEKNQFIEGFLSLYSYAGLENTSFISPITKNMYANSYFIIALDCDGYKQSQAGSSLIVKKNVSITVDFHVALPEPVTIFCMATSSRLLEISAERSVFYFDY